MASASCTADAGRSCSIKCFPAGTLPHRRREGAAHWLVAYREAEEQKYRNLRRRIKETYKKRESELAKTSHPVTLDRAFLLQLHHVAKPSELCSLEISEQKLNSVKPEDLEVFDNVAFIDASINSLSLGSFSSFVSLRELNLSLNGVCNMTFDAADFPHLEVLDLSYNRLSPDAIVSLGRLPRLKILHLTANQLQRLPPNLGSSNQDPAQQPAKEEQTYFRALEVLMLDDNKLSSGVFNSLRNLKRLKHLSLQANRISEIPFMQLVGYSKSGQIPTKEQAEEEAGEAHTQSEPTDRYLISEIFHRDNWEQNCNESSLPLPELQYLNLADNKIAKEEALLAATLFPVLREIDIQFNPITTQRRGDPPLLAYLQERLGITIKQKKTHADVKRPLKVSAELKWKVEENIPKASRKLVLMNAQTQAGRNEGKKSRSNAFHKNRKPFFLTQAADGPEFEFRLLSEHKETAENKERNNANPEQCDRLMDAEPNPHVLKPNAGIQTAVRMLERTLKNLNVYRDPKPKLDSIQTPYREREKRIKELPLLKPMKQPNERVDDMMKEIRESKAIKVVALVSCTAQAVIRKTIRKLFH
ncbi:X-ray radiation resistance-associated protein 1 isoform X2 [Archocentrus centrarchus]|uniref:X-ray radiation resistance-associated protein 1 isoform X2 n=1 Tax=Archocentrus centrarchus TaxID=63155 RepID=UPI0011EA5114|nr:X-ray radiation resistance-associated protein 1 isoform X2 [Archocentrus centrarchus]